MSQDILYCGNCDEFTVQDCSTYPSEHRTCHKCGWEYYAIIGMWRAPIAPPKDE